MSSAQREDVTKRLAETLIHAARSKGVKIATAESCTGGLVSAAITNIAGSSDIFECGFVTYSNDSKARLLNVPPALIVQHGAVSAEVARAMAEGALNVSPATLSVAITGIAGPGGGSATKPVGLVHFASASKAHPTRQIEKRYGEQTRDVIRAAAVVTALEFLIEALDRF